MFHVKHIKIKGEKTMTKTNTKNFDMVVREKKAMLEVIESLMADLASKERISLCDMVKTGEHQGKSWNGELYYISEDGKRTTEVTDKPYMVDDYEYVLKKSMDADDKALSNAINTIRETLASLV